MMAGIKGINTRPEMLVRLGLHGRGFRYRLHSSDLPGKPDIVLPRYGAVIFVHGCFWHAHACHLFRWPASRPDFWKQKISRNHARDKEVRKTLADAGWRVLVIWECALKGRERRTPEAVISAASKWI